MASTNKTSNYELSQYIGTDKPTYLNDYNNDMYKIDAGMYANNYAIDQTNAKLGDLTNLTTESKTTLVEAINEVDSNTNTTDSKIGDLTNLETTRKDNLVVATNENTENINTNASKIGTLTNLNTTSKTNLVSAINEVNGKINFTTLFESVAGQTGDIEFNGNFNSYDYIIVNTDEGTGILCPKDNYKLVISYSFFTVELYTIYDVLEFTYDSGTDKSNIEHIYQGEFYSNSDHSLDIKIYNVTGVKLA